MGAGNGSEVGERRGVEVGERGNGEAVGVSGVPSDAVDVATVTRRDVLESVVRKPLAFAASIGVVAVDSRGISVVGTRGDVTDTDSDCIENTSLDGISPLPLPCLEKVDAGTVNAVLPTSVDHTELGDGRGDGVGDDDLGIVVSSESNALVDISPLPLPSL